MRAAAQLFRICTTGICMAVISTFAAQVRANDPLDIEITYFGHAKRELPPVSLVAPILDDEGVAGARQAIEDNQTTGSFLGQDYSLDEIVVPEEEDVEAAFAAALADGKRLFVADLVTADLMAIAPLADEAGALVFNSRSHDDALRRDACFASVMHVAPSRAMLADALAQYLVWKRWTSWFVVKGSHPEDELLAAAYERAAKRFGAKFVETRIFEDTGGARRTDSGHVQLQRQMPVATQDAPEHQVLIAIDESDVFGEYLPYLTWDPRPVAGSAGLTPTSWSRVHEQWGGTQVQRRFEKFAGRWMTARDYNAWLAVRILGEAVTRTSSADAKTLHDYMVSDAFEIAAFKGEGLTFRPWNQQLRQPILIVQPRMLVSVSPQEQFLHQRTHLDTLGYDEPESACKLNG